MLPSGLGGDGTTAQRLALTGVDKDVVQVKVQRYEDVIDSLKRLCEAERRRTRQARAAHMAELAARTELQSVLRQCVDDVRARQAQAQQPGGSAGPASQSGAAVGEQPRSSGPGSFSRRPNAAALGGRPGSALPRGSAWSSANSFPRAGGGLRPASALPGSFGSQGSLASDGVQGEGSSSGGPLTAAERESLVAKLQQQEDLLVRLMDKAFPGIAPPSLPGDSAGLDALAAAREARDAQVAANGRALAAMRNQASAGRAAGGAAGLPPRPIPHNVMKDATPGSEVAKEAAGRPWVFNVDTMLSEFLSS